MYIYYGSSGAMRKSFGGSVIIVGAVFSLAAQILAIILSMLRNRFVKENFIKNIPLQFYASVDSVVTTIR